MAKDRLFSRKSVFFLTDQNPLEDGFFNTKNRRPWINDGRLLTKSDYCCDWLIKSNKLFILDAYLYSDGSSLFPRLFPGEEKRAHATWFSGCLSATNTKPISYLTSNKTIKGEFKNKRVSFYVREGYVYRVILQKLPSQID